MSSNDTLAILSAKILVSNLYIRFTQEIGMKSNSSVSVGFLGIRVIKVWLEDLSMGLPLKKFLTHVSTVCFSSGHKALKNSTVNPSGPGDFPDWKEKSVDLISSSEGCWTSQSFISGRQPLGIALEVVCQGKGGLYITPKIGGAPIL